LIVQGNIKIRNRLCQEKFFVYFETYNVYKNKFCRCLQHLKKVPEMNKDIHNNLGQPPTFQSISPHSHFPSILNHALEHRLHTLLLLNPLPNPPLQYPTSTAPIPNTRPAPKHSSPTPSFPFLHTLLYPPLPGTSLSDPNVYPSLLHNTPPSFTHLNKEEKTIKLCVMATL
jgi:hypothetical protein